MKKLLPLFILTIACVSTHAQWEKETQQLKLIITEGFEALSQPTRQWFVDKNEQQTDIKFNPTIAKTQLQQKFGFSYGDGAGDLLACLMQYMKDVAKEIRENKEIKTEFTRLVLASKSEKLKMQNEAIDQGMREARERAESAMNAAYGQMVLGIVSGLVQITAGAASFGKIPLNNPPNRIDSIKLKLINPAKYNAQQKKEMLAEYLKKLQMQLNYLKKKAV